MSYQVPFTDQANKGEITVEESSFNNDTSLSLPGRLITDYGLAVNTNFLQLKDNFGMILHKKLINLKFMMAQTGLQQVA